MRPRVTPLLLAFFVLLATVLIPAHALASTAHSHDQEGGAGSVVKLSWPTAADEDRSNDLESQPSSEVQPHGATPNSCPAQAQGAAMESIRHRRAAARASPDLQGLRRPPRLGLDV